MTEITIGIDVAGDITVEKNEPLIEVIQPVPQAIIIETGAAPGVSKAYVDARTPPIAVGTTPPANPAVNDVWIDTN